jgi:hypothetical protein
MTTGAGQGFRPQADIVCHWLNEEDRMKYSLLVAVAAVGFATHASANLVDNPSFEAFTGSFGGDGGAQLLSTSTTLTGWTVHAGEIAVLKTPNAYNLAAADGLNFLDLAGYTNSGFPKGVSQTLSGLQVGGTYSFSMDLGIRNGACVGSGSNCSGPVQASATVGTTSQTFTENSSAAGNVWGTFGFNFFATSPTMTLTINGVSLPAGHQFVGLDNVSVNVAAVPEAETCALMLVGLAVLGLIVRARRAGLERGTLIPDLGGDVLPHRSRA